VESYYL